MPVTQLEGNIMGLNTPRNHEKRDEKFDDQKKTESPVEKVRRETEKKVIDTMK